MKITNFAILFVLIICPLLVFQGYDLLAQKNVQEKTNTYDRALTIAVQDAAKELTFSRISTDDKYESGKKLVIEPDKVVDTFLKTMYINFGVEGDPTAESRLMSYIPAVLITDYDGYYVYTSDSYIKAGVVEQSHVWRNKKPYTYADSQGNSISFTLDDYVYVYQKSSNTFFEGRFGSLKNNSSISVPLLKGSLETFEQVRRTSIVDALQKDLEYTINNHTQYNSQNGVMYTFTLPLVGQEEWLNTVNDVGVLAFVQGIPLGTGYYNNFAFGGGRIKPTEQIYAVGQGANKYYFRSRCMNTLGYSFSDVIESFQSQKDAANKGYKPKDCINPSAT